jgi:hypothetical protein
VWTAVSVDSKFGQLCYPLTIREVWAASLDSCKCGQQVVWTASSVDSCKCGQQVWTAVLSIDTSCRELEEESKFLGSFEISEEVKSSHVVGL